MRDEAFVADAQASKINNINPEIPALTACMNIRRVLGAMSGCWPVGVLSAVARFIVVFPVHMTRLRGLLKMRGLPLSLPHEIECEFHAIIDWVLVS